MALPGMLLNPKSEVKDMLRGAAVFVPPVGPCCHIRGERVHVFTGVNAFVRSSAVSVSWRFLISWSLACCVPVKQASPKL